jgi:RNA polymerase sigma factor (sigma-70 family)
MNPADELSPDAEPSLEERRRAACSAMAAGPGLVRYAARFTRSLPDAEDAYQRAMEIALTRAPVVEPKRFRAWLHAVVRNEALAISRSRRREGPAGAEDVAVTAARSVEEPVGPEALAEWRERYRAVQDGLAGLTESQRICVMLKSAGASYAEIAAITGFSLRKVERSVLEGRAGLHAWEARMAAGKECEKVRSALDRVAEGSAGRSDSRTVSRHIRHCHGCRGLLRARRQSYDGLAALVPPALVMGDVTHALPADPSTALGYWDRLAGGATVRVGQAWQAALEIPGALTAKVGAGAAAAVLAGAAGGPAVVDAVKGSSHDRREAARIAVREGKGIASAIGRPVPAQRTAKPRARAKPATPARIRAPLSRTTLRQIAHVATLVQRSRRPSATPTGSTASEAQRATVATVASPEPSSPPPATPTPTAPSTPPSSAPSPSAPAPEAPPAASGNTVALEFGP